MLKFPYMLTLSHTPPVFTSVESLRDYRGVNNWGRNQEVELVSKV